MIDSIDKSVLDFFVNNRFEWLSFLMLVVTYSGGFMVVSTVTLLSSISFFLHKHTSRILPLLASVVGSVLTTLIIKSVWNKSRPLLEAIYTESTSAFPSTHASVAIALYGFLIWTIWKHDKHHFKNPFIVFLFILILLIGVSRLYLGVHFLSDVLAGYLVGFIWLSISLAIPKLKS